PRFRTLIVNDVVVGILKMLAIAHRLVLPTRAPNRSRKLILYGAGRYAFRLPDDRSHFPDVARKLSDRVSVRFVYRDGEQRVSGLFELGDHRAPDHRARLARDVNFTAAFLFHVTLQSRVFTSRRTIFVITGRVNSMLPIPKPALV